MLNFQGCNLVQFVNQGKVEVDIIVTNITVNPDNAVIDCDLHGEIKMYTIGNDGTYVLADTIPVTLEGAELSGGGNS